MELPVTPLQARTFGVWTLTSAVIRFYAAYNINNKAYVASVPYTPTRHSSLIHPQHLRHGPRVLPHRLLPLLDRALHIRHRDYQRRRHEPRRRLQCVISFLSFLSQFFPALLFLVTRFSLNVLVSPLLPVISKKLNLHPYLSSNQPLLDALAVRLLRPSLGPFFMWAPSIPVARRGGTRELLATILYLYVWNNIISSYPCFLQVALYQ